MADYDFSKPAPDRSHRIPIDGGSGAGGVGFILAGLAIILVVLYAVFGGAAVPVDQTPAEVTAPAAPVADGAPAAPAQ
ncbi:hypothetical protein [Pseudooctadecabacter jejudonensis]|uniref:Uncharacterized protein n=1 Tax=Pseudooctadecabacter jejudonensis TaxID=1391910 RepID=A0A1Y5RH69_9RHOB|nr:hypothetical protein [Pseudooctadecabacter jejudonensis]SLN17337.1 hypothetical protein PSJ8397_00547 [Pseudooctadecabacter jejudonensis]